MVKRFEVYKCGICGNIVEVLHVGGGKLVCCGKPMEMMVEKSADQGKEKHVPVVERTDEGVKVKVGSVAHPMEEKHFIEWIEVLTEDGVMRKFLEPGEAPEAEFAVKDVKMAREYCTIHGLWKG
jgi:superoxide reductase